ncbi:MAG: hypothetical protein HHJ17_11525 [Rhodoferax sp.]|uniref:hypothetical protein n=1 Tax=Rhodoferax sp. TaxID=50421 RepID=UPI001830C73B|nr:hypothetical protein [Rhodoferax sp.]NMM14152.1 hypothetical protein [Rhodoferax sp.]
MREPLHIEVPDMSHMMPMRISVAKVKAMSDAELLAALNGEDGRKGMMTMQFLQLITSELQARSIERAGKPHWSTVPSFWLLVGSLVISLAALAVAVIALPTQGQQPVSADQLPPQTPSLGQSTPASSQPASQSSTPAPAGKQRR